MTVNTSLFQGNWNKVFRSIVIQTTCTFMAWMATSIPSLAWHPISLSSAIVDVRPDNIRIELQIMAEDLVLYHRIPADGKSVYSADDLKAATIKHRQFVLDYLSILDQDGNRLSGQVVEQDDEQIVPAGIAQTELMNCLVTYQLEYKLPKQNPAFLTFLQTFGGPKAVLPAVMDFYIAQSDALVEPPSQLNYGRPHTVKLDWTPGTDKPRTIQELRKKRSQQFKERLGISTYSGLYSFLYITRFEVRHEILIPLLTLEQWVPLDRADADYMSVEEQAAAKEKIEQFFQEHGEVDINGQTVPAKLVRLNFFGLDIADFALNADPRRVSVHQARVGVILSYTADQSPKTVRARWSTFSEQAPFLRSLVLIEKTNPVEHYFNQKTTQYEWSGQLTGPTLEPIRGSIKSMLSNDGKTLMGSLLSNIYRAFDFRDDEAVYDALATSVQGDLLRDMYLRIKRTLLVAEQGGAIAHVTSVETTELNPDKSAREPATFVVQWQVTGVSEHWGHIHTRTSQYRARIRLAEKDSQLRLAYFQLMEENQIKFETSIRGYDSNP